MVYYSLKISNQYGLFSKNRPNKHHIQQLHAAVNSVGCKSNKEEPLKCLGWFNPESLPACGIRPTQIPSTPWARLFLFYVNIFFQKYMSVLKNFENGPRSSVPGATGVCRPPPTPPTGNRGSPTLYKPWPPFSSHLSLKIAPKIQKKREG